MNLLALSMPEPARSIMTTSPSALAAAFTVSIDLKWRSRIGSSGFENQGWAITKFLLGNERTGIARIGMSKQLIRRAKLLARTRDADAEARFLEQAALVEIGLKALEVTQMRLLDAARQGEGRPDPRSSILKVQGTELRQAARVV